MGAINPSEAEEAFAKPCVPAIRAHSSHSLGTGVRSGVGGAVGRGWAPVLRAREEGVPAVRGAGSRRPRPSRESAEPPIGPGSGDSRAEQEGNRSRARRRRCLQAVQRLRHRPSACRSAPRSARSMSGLRVYSTSVTGSREVSVRVCARVGAKGERRRPGPCGPSAGTRPRRWRWRWGCQGGDREAPQGAGLYHRVGSGSRLHGSPRAPSWGSYVLSPILIFPRPSPVAVTPSSLHPCLQADAAHDLTVPFLCISTRGGDGSYSASSQAYPAFPCSNSRLSPF